MVLSKSVSDLAVLVAALLLLALVAGGIAACGDSDLFFPGEIPPTAVHTATPDDEEEEEEDEDEDEP